METLKELYDVYRILMQGETNYDETNGDQVEKCTNATCEKRLKFLESLVHELLEHNMILMLAMMETESESRKRVEALEKFLERTAQSTQSYMVEMNNHEQYISRLIKNKHTSFDHIKKLQDKCVELTKEKWSLQDHNNNLNQDISSLLRLIAHARNTGHWDVGNIEFCDVSFEDVFGSVEQFSSRMSREENGSYRCDSPSGISTQSILEDYGIGKLFSGSLAGSTYSSAVQYLSGRRVSRNEVHLFKLQTRIRHYQQLINDLHNQLTERNKMIADLQIQNTDLCHELFVKDTEHYEGHLSQLQMGNHFCPLSRRRRRSDSPVCLSEQSENVVTTTQLVPLKHAHAQYAVEDYTNHHENCYQHDADPEKHEYQLTECHRCSAAINVSTEDIVQALQRSLLHGHGKESTEAVLSSIAARLTNGDNTMSEQTLKMQCVDLDGGNNNIVKCYCDVAVQTVLEEFSGKLVEVQILEDRSQGNMNDFETGVKHLLGECEKSGLTATLSNEIAPDEAAFEVEQVSELQQSVLNLKSEIQAAMNVIQRKNVEIDQQKVTIGNLQDAIVSMKTPSSIRTVVIPVGNVESTAVNNSNCKPGGIFDI